MLGHGRGLCRGRLRGNQLKASRRHFRRVCEFFPLKNAQVPGTLHPGHLLLLEAEGKTSRGFFTCSEKLE